MFKVIRLHNNEREIKRAAGITLYEKPDGYVYGIVGPKFRASNNAFCGTQKQCERYISGII